MPKGTSSSRERDVLMVKKLKNVLLYYKHVYRQSPFYLLHGILIIKTPKLAIFMK